MFAFVRHDTVYGSHRFDMAGLQSLQSFFLVLLCRTPKKLGVLPICHFDAVVGDAGLGDGWKDC